MCSCQRLPSVNQLTMSSDRAMLAVLDLSLELTARSLRAEHPSLDEQPYRGSHEPPVTHEALAASIVILASTLREVIAGYRESLDYIFGDREEEEPDVPF
jgi:hypothetical protein